MNQKIGPSAPAFELFDMTPELADVLGPAIAGIEPWVSLNFQPELMTAFMKNEDPALQRMAVFVDGVPAGVVAVRERWLRGPYLQLLALLPPYQGQGLGTALLEWFAQQAGPYERWLWLCCSAFNSRALAFYQRNGYEQIAVLPDQIVDGMNELLLRKRGLQVYTTKAQCCPPGTE
ncbi:MAG: GNAT family N-acetyltransferase [Alphaproteobacteria bacterium]